MQRADGRPAMARGFEDVQWHQEEDARSVSS